MALMRPRKPCSSKTLKSLAQKAGDGMWLSSKIVDAARDGRQNGEA
jgi:hypothetical protein